MYQKKTHSFVLTAFLSVMSLILSFVKIVVPFIPPFLTLDLAFIPLFFGLLIIGYKNTLLISFIKNILHVVISHDYIGSFANLIVEIIFISCFLFFYKKGNKMIIFGGLISTISITFVMAIINYFILLPLFGIIMDLTDITNNLKIIVTYSIIPFNIIKGIFLIVLFFITKKIIKNIPQSLLNKFK